jgi:hypothetical protein
MGRSKPAPKRRRIEEEEAEANAIQTLLNAPQEQVDAAAAAATRYASDVWPKLELELKDGDKVEVPDWLTGLGASTTLPPQHFQALQALHDKIKEQATTWTSWSGSVQDPRKRAFGFLPNTLGYKEETRTRLDISTPWKEEDTTEERTRNHGAMVLLKELPPGVKEAMDYLCQTFSESLADSSSFLRDHLNYSNLIAAQPNLHCGRELLPSHVDHPLKDGFGVVIITISMVGSGTILLKDYKAANKMTMVVKQGQAYMLADKARDACAHGVLTTTGEGHRESLNLRFGLHDLKTSKLSLISSRQVLQYWETNVDEDEPSAILTDQIAK